MSHALAIVLTPGLDSFKSNGLQVTGALITTRRRLRSISETELLCNFLAVLNWRLVFPEGNRTSRLGDFGEDFLGLGQLVQR